MKNQNDYRHHNEQYHNNKRNRYSSQYDHLSCPSFSLTSILNIAYHQIKTIKLFLIILLQFNQRLWIDALELRANCGFPGKPYRSKIIPEEKLIYEEGETVSFQCSDYWAPPQMRKCVNGIWVGPPARCGDFVRDVLMHDAKLLDMSFGLPIEKFHYRNMNLTTTNWKYPNAFTSNRYHEHRLRVTNDHEYMWKFNFTRLAVKLFVKVNFNFINFTLLDQTIKNNFSFYIDVEISPYRTCNLDYQSNNAWRDNGNRIDSYFTCEAHSYQDLVRDLENPSNYMIMRTKSSHNLPHEMVALFFGHVYGNETEPVCGEPETDFGQSYRANQEHKDYIVDCLSGLWKDVTPNAMKHFVYNQKCIGDMVWNGTRPRCVPTRNCPIQNLLTYNRRNKTEIEKNPLVIDAVLHYYNFIDNQTIYAIDGTEIVYACASVDYILVGKDTRTCKRDMTWSGTEPVCKYIKPTNEAIESPNYLIVIIIFMGILLFLIILASCLLFLFCTKHLKIIKKGDKNSDEPANNEWKDENYYDNIEMNFNQQQTGKNDVFYDIYETVDSNKVDGNLVRYTEPSQYFYGSEQGAIGSNVMVNQNNNSNNNSQNKENDYIRMFGAVKVHDTNSGGGSVNNPMTLGSMGNVHHSTSQNQIHGSSIRTNTKNVKVREPSYLEVMQ